MKVPFLNPYLLGLVLLLFCGCSSSSGEDPEVIEEIETTQVKIQSFSGEYVYVDNEATLLGENFGSDKSKIKIQLDGVAVEIQTVAPNRITFKIPTGTSTFPELKMEIPNASILFEETYEGITVLENDKNQWIAMEHSFGAIESIKDFKGVSKERIYFAIKSSTSDPSSSAPCEVKKSSNGGANIYVLNQDYNFFSGGVHITPGNKEYSFRGGHLYRYAQGNPGDWQLLDDFSGNSSWPLDFYVDDEEKNTVVATSEGRIYRSTNNGAFEKEYEKMPTGRYEFDSFFALSPNHIWLGGFTFQESTYDYSPAKILQLKQDGNWYGNTVEVEIKDGNFESIKNILFVNEAIGFGIVKITNYIEESQKYVIIRSGSSGDFWNIVHEHDGKIEGFTFKDENTGWFIAGRDIYQTVDGGTTWEVMHTSNTDCKGILYHEETLWVMANNQLLKYYF